MCVCVCVCVSTLTKKSFEGTVMRQPRESQKQCSHQNPTVLAPDLRLPPSRMWEINFCYLSCPISCILLQHPKLTNAMCSTHLMNNWATSLRQIPQVFFKSWAMCISWLVSALRWGDHIQCKAIISCVPWFWFWPLGEVSLFSQSYASGRTVSYSRMSSM